MRARTTMRAAIIAAGLLALAGCQAEGESGIAHLSGASSPSTSAAASAASAEDQALAFAQCMRDNGVDFPDPTVDADGNLSFAGAFRQAQGGGFDPGDSSFRDAMDACRDLMDGLTLGGGRAGGDFDSSALQEAMLALHPVPAWPRASTSATSPSTVPDSAERGQGLAACSPPLRRAADRRPGSGNSGVTPPLVSPKSLGRTRTIPSGSRRTPCAQPALQEAMSSVGFGAGAAAGQG